MDEAELKRRTKVFGLRVFKLVEALPGNLKGRAIGNQLVRSGPAHRLAQTIGLLAGLDRALNSSPVLEWSRKRQMRARTGWR